MSKVCLTCMIDKALEEFPPRSSSPCGYYPYCKVCVNKKGRYRRSERNAEGSDFLKREAETARRWRKNNPDKVTAMNVARRKKGIKNGTIIDGWVAKKYKGVACLDCESVYPWCVMDFDHRPGESKSFSISQRGNRATTPSNVAEVEKEIAKCDLVCSNCHRVRTQERRNEAQ